MLRARATSLPASRISAMSRGVFSSGDCEKNRLSMESTRPGFEQPGDGGVQVFDRVLGLDLVQNSLLAIVVEEFARRVAEDGQPVADSLFAVIGPPLAGLIDAAHQAPH